jgi:hypothetical protein
VPTHRAVSRSLVFCLALSGCVDVDNDLAGCLNDTEPTVLLRQLNLTGKDRENFDWCMQERTGFKKEFCRDLYVNASTPVRVCMKQRWYTFTDANSGYGTCASQYYAKASCYKPTWYLRLMSVFGSKSN